MLKVLVVEDEELIRKGIILTVDWASLDCVVVGEAANGEEALEAVERFRPSLIITDLKAPHGRHRAAPPPPGAGQPRLCDHPHRL